MKPARQRVFEVVDGFTVTMLSTPENQRELSAFKKIRKAGRTYSRTGPV